MRNAEEILGKARISFVRIVDIEKMHNRDVYKRQARTGPTVASLVSTLEPVVTVLASAVLLSEPVTLSIVLGGVLVLASLLVTVRPGGKPEG